MHCAPEIDELDVDPWVLRLKNWDACLVLFVVGVCEDPKFQGFALLLGTSEDEKCRDEKKHQHDHRALTEWEAFNINRETQHKNSELQKLT